MIDSGNWKTVENVVISVYYLLLYISNIVQPFKANNNMQKLMITQSAMERSVDGYSVSPAQ